MKILAFGISHHPALAYYDTTSRLLQYIELEKYTKIKYYAPIPYNGKYDYNLSYLQYIKEILKLYSISNLDVVVIDNDESSAIPNMYATYFKNKKLTKEVVFQCNHNLNHVLPSILNTNKDCLALDIEGMGDERVSTLLFEYKKNLITPVKKIKNFSYGFVYKIVGSLILSIVLNKDIDVHDASIPGKFMALCGMSENYIKSIGDYIYDMIQNANEDTVWNEKYTEKTANNRIYIYIKDCLTKYNVYDVAYTFQQTWIKSILNLIDRNRKDYTNFVISGGCALNCQLNYEIYKSQMFEKITWNPIPDDSGQSLGILYYFLYKNNLPYPLLNNYKCSTPLYDCDKIQHLHTYKQTNITEIVDMLVDNKLVGLVRGNVEVGPRALGRRSILANPLIQSNKDYLNNEIKNREWFRPYGIIIPREYLTQFYNIDVDCDYMNIVGYNKTNIPKAVIHYDNTTRIQTVTKESDEWLYNLLLEFGNRTGCPILINTSFNGKGQPIYNWFSDIYSFYYKKLDTLILDDRMIVK